MEAQKPEVDVALETRAAMEGWKTFWMFLCFNGALFAAIVLVVFLG